MYYITSPYQFRYITVSGRNAEDAHCKLCYLLGEERYNTRKRQCEIFNHEKAAHYFDEVDGFILHQFYDLGRGDYKLFPFHTRAMKLLLGNVKMFEVLVMLTPDKTTGLLYYVIASKPNAAIKLVVDNWAHSEYAQYKIYATKASTPLENIATAVAQDQFGFITREETVSPNIQNAQTTSIRVSYWK